MRTPHLAAGAIVLFVCLTATERSLAGCVLPVPDGADAKPSPANLHGRITRIENDEVVIAQAKTGKIVRVLLPTNSKVFTAFGGDASPSELILGQTVWVWFLGCKWPSTAPATSAYFQVYSMDPNDRP